MTVWQTIPVVFFFSLAMTRIECQEDFGGAKFGNFGDFGNQQPKFCPPYRCQKGHEAVPSWPLKLTSTGCHGMGGVAMFAKAKADKDDPHTPCCDFRNACLQTCGAIKTFCDEEFLKCSKAACENLGSDVDEEAKKSCETSASIHQLMVNMDQCKAFDAGQYSHCTCVKSSDAPAKRERILRSFYKKYKPDSVDKVPALAEKVRDNPRKMAGLLFKLIQKYPESIKKMKDPQQQMMEDMMKEAEQNNKIKKEDLEDAGTNDNDEDDGSEDLGTQEL